jgi:heme-degrading monooxygenase HmoA
MMLILFRSKLVDADREGYARMAEAMDAHARTFDGFIDAKSFLADDGERLTVVWWRDEASLKVWATDARHRVAQERGRERWYEYYRMDVAEIVRVSNFDRPPAPAGGVR